MTVFRMNPSDEFVYDIMSIFLSRPSMDRLQEIHIQSLNHASIVQEMTSLFPTLQLYYYPGKLASLVTHDDNNYVLTFDTCIKILRQVLRAKGYRVRTNTIRKHNTTDKVIIVIPSANT